MQFSETGLPGLFLIEPRAFGDERGYFMETFSQRAFTEATGIGRPFVQDNYSYSRQRGIIRGLHFQAPPHAQAKLVRVVIGEVLDVVVDLRVGSPTYGQQYSVRLSAENKRQLYVPRGFAHAFVVLSQETGFAYKCDGFYHQAAEGGLLWSDPELAIDWQLGDTQPLLSDKDQQLPLLKDLKSPFVYGRD